MGIDLKRIETGETPAGYRDDIYSRDARAHDIVSAQVALELKKLEATRYGDVQALKAQLGEGVVHERAKQQLAAQYASNTHLLRIWEHEQGNVAEHSRRGSGMAI